MSRELLLTERKLIEQVRVRLDYRLAKRKVNEMDGVIKPPEQRQRPGAIDDLVFLLGVIDRITD